MASLGLSVRLVSVAALVAFAPAGAFGQEAAPPEATSEEQAPAREAKEVVTRRLERQVGDRRFEVVVQASGWVDPRALDYLGEGLKIVPVPKPDRRELWAFRSVGAAVDPRSDEITVTLSALDGGDVRSFSWLPPDGFELVRPAVLRPRRELSEGLARAQDASFRKAAPTPEAVREADVPRPFTRMTGRIRCTAWNGTSQIVRPLGFVTIAVDGAQAPARADGTHPVDEAALHGGGMGDPH